MPNDDYDQLMQEDAKARERQGEFIAGTLLGLKKISTGTDLSAWEYAPLERDLTVQECLAVLEVAHGLGIVEWESWHEGW